jgi:hypothetical protein
MAHGRRIAAVLAIAAAATVGDAAIAPALSVGPVSTPSTVSTPSVTVPGTTVTVPNTPAPTPTATAPSPAPHVSSPPKVSVPKATTPTVTVPSTTVTTPKVTTTPVVKKVTGGGGGSGGSAPSGPGTSGTSGTSGGLVNSVKQALPKVGGGGSVAVSPSSGSTGAIVGAAKAGYSASGSGAGSGTSGVSPLFGGTPGGPGGGGFSGPSGFGGPGGFAGGPGSPAAFALGFQRGPNGIVWGAGTGGVSAFAAAVGALAGCFYALTPFEQQVLVVRSGIDGRQALSRSKVAALLGTTPASIAATENTALSELLTASATSGCMPVGRLGPANALTAFIGGPFGPIGYVTPGIPGPSRAEPGVPEQTSLASTSFADKLSTLGDGGQASLSVLMIIAVMLAGALAALFAEARRSVT